MKGRRLGNPRLSGFFETPWRLLDLRACVVTTAESAISRPDTREFIITKLRSPMQREGFGLDNFNQD